MVRADAANHFSKVSKPQTLAAISEAKQTAASASLGKDEESRACAGGRAAIVPQRMDAGTVEASGIG